MEEGGVWWEGSTENLPREKAENQGQQAKDFDWPPRKRHFSGRSQKKQAGLAVKTCKQLNTGSLNTQTKP